MAAFGLGEIIISANWAMALKQTEIRLFRYGKVGMGLWMI
jgi:hypothetical protein